MRVVSYLIVVAALSLTSTAFAQSPGAGAFWPIRAEQFGKPIAGDPRAESPPYFGDAGRSVLQDGPPSVSIDTVAAEQGTSKVLANCNCGECNDCCDDCGPYWDFQFMSMLVWRDNDSQNGALIRPETIDLDAGGGSRLLSRWMFNPNQAIEAQWYAFANSGGKMYYSSSNFYLTDYDSSLSNGEISYVRTWNRFSLLGGFRALRWSEDYRELHTPQGSELHLHTDNDLFGGQVGARWRQERPKFFWELTGKFGVFGNQANRSQLITYGYGNSGWTAFPRQADFGTSVVYELNLAMGFRLSPVWSLRAGYDFIFIDQLVLAPNQYSSGGLRPLATDGNVLLNGLEVGLEALW
jgi:hypothetical protein